VNYSIENMADTMASVSASTTRMRFAKTAGVDTKTLYDIGLYTKEEITSMNTKK